MWNRISPIATAERRKVSRGSRNIRVRVKLYASLREKLRTDEKVLELKNPSFSSLLNRLAEATSGGIDVIATSKGELRDNVIVSINGSLVRPADLRRVTLKEGDRIDIMPLPSGG